MSYFTGTFDNFGRRLHSLPSGIGDLDNFRIEGQQYTGINAIGGNYSLSKNMKNHWNKEFIQQCSGILHFPTGTPIFV